MTFVKDCVFPITGAIRPFKIYEKVLHGYFPTLDMDYGSLVYKQKILCKEVGRVSGHSLGTCLCCEIHTAQKTFSAVVSYFSKVSQTEHNQHVSDEDQWNLV